MNHLASSQTILAAGWSGGEHGGGWPWALIPLLWIALIGLLVWFLTRRRPPAETSGLGRARDLLAERYARGEVSIDEYRERLGNLQ